MQYMAKSMKYPKMNDTPICRMMLNLSASLPSMTSCRATRRML